MRPCQNDNPAVTCSRSNGVPVTTGNLDNPFARQGSSHCVDAAVNTKVTQAQLSKTVWTECYEKSNPLIKKHVNNGKSLQKKLTYNYCNRKNQLKVSEMVPETSLRWL